MFEAESLAQPGVRGLRAYDPGHDIIALRRRFADGPQPLVELGSNENAFGPSPTVGAAIGAALPLLHRYPDPLGSDLRAAIAASHGLAPARLVLGNGSHELLVMLAQVFAGPGTEVLVSQYGFAVYALAAQAVGARLVVAPALAAGATMPRGHDLDAISSRVTAATRLVYLANPNNPTGTWFAQADLATLMRAVPTDTIVVVDEAYAEFCDADGPVTALSLLDAHPNLVVTRTFSKAYGLAGLRVGYAVAHPSVAALLERLRESFNVNALGLAAAEAALADAAHLAHVRRRTIEARSSLAAALQARGLAVSPSQTNFLLVEFGTDCARVEAALLARGVVLRPMGGYGLPHCSRITVGTEPEQRTLLAALDACLGGGP